MIRLKSEKRYAQQLVEFLLVVPFVIIILGIITEYAYAMYVRMVVNEGLKESTTKIYKTMSPDITSTVIESNVKEDLTKYLQDHNIATEYRNTSTGALEGTAIQLQMVTLTDNTVFVATYKYIPSIILPMGFPFLPEQLNFMLISSVPNAFVNGNTTYQNTINSATLDKAWGASNFANLADFNATKKGVINGTGPNQNAMIFLASVTGIPPLAGNKIYAIIDWWGNIAQNGTAYKIANTTDGNIYDCTYTPATIIPPAAAYWTCPANGTIKGYLTDYTSFIFVHDTGIPINASGGTISTTDWNNVLKRAVAIADSSQNTLGNYDNLNVYGYNQFAATANNIYTVQVDSNKKVFVYKPADDNIGQIIN